MNKEMAKKLLRTVKEVRAENKTRDRKDNDEIIVVEKADYNVKYLSKKEQGYLYGLFLFVRGNEDFTDEDLFRFVTAFPIKFGVYKKFYDYIPDLVDELRMHGYHSICMRIVHERYMDSELKKL